MLSKLVCARLIVAFAAPLLCLSSAFAQDAAAVQKRASDAMGAGQLKTLRYTAEGTGYTFGQAFKPGMLEIHPIQGSVHSDTFVMVYLPKEKLLIEADAYTPSAPNAAPPAPPNPNNVNLIENIERLKLSIDRILPLHGRVVPLADLYTAAGATMPK